VSTPETAILGSRAMVTITAAARIMYPHDALPDDVYARVGEKLAEAAGEDSGAARTIAKGVSALNAGQPFAELLAGEHHIANESGRFDGYPLMRCDCRRTRRLTAAAAAPGLSSRFWRGRRARVRGSRP
jgi:hypothetical protein